jgi:hypothetical protein
MKMENGNWKMETGNAAAHAQPAASGEQWLGRNTGEKRRLWEQLNPRHRKQLQLLARALVVRQTQGRLPDDVRVRLSGVLDEIERLIAKVETLLAALVARRRI